MAKDYRPKFWEWYRILREHGWGVFRSLRFARWMSRKAALILAGTLLLGLGVRAAEKALYRTHRLSVADVAVSCADGGRPVVQEVATDKRVIIVSCPFEAEEHAPRGANR